MKRRTIENSSQTEDDSSYDTSDTLSPEIKLSKTVRRITVEKTSNSNGTLSGKVQNAFSKPKHTQSQMQEDSVASFRASTISSNTINMDAMRFTSSSHYQTQVEPQISDMSTYNILSKLYSNTKQPTLFSINAILEYNEILQLLKAKNINASVKMKKGQLAFILLESITKGIFKSDLTSQPPIDSITAACSVEIGHTTEAKCSEEASRTVAPASEKGAVQDTQFEIENSKREAPSAWECQSYKVISEQWKEVTDDRQRLLDEDEKYNSRQIVENLREETFSHNTAAMKLSNWVPVSLSDSELLNRDMNCSKWIDEILIDCLRLNLDWKNRKYSNKINGNINACERCLFANVRRPVPSQTTLGAAVNDPQWHVAEHREDPNPSNSKVEYQARSIGFTNGSMSRAPGLTRTDKPIISESNQQNFTQSIESEIPMIRFPIHSNQKKAIRSNFDESIYNLRGKPAMVYLTKHGDAVPTLQYECHEKTLGFAFSQVNRSNCSYLIQRKSEKKSFAIVLSGITNSDERNPPINSELVAINGKVISDIIENNNGPRVSFRTAMKTIAKARRPIHLVFAEPITSSSQRQTGIFANNKSI